MQAIKLGDTCNNNAGNVVNAIVLDVAVHMILICL